MRSAYIAADEAAQIDGFAIHRKNRKVTSSSKLEQARKVSTRVQNSREIKILLTSPHGRGESTRQPLDGMCRSGGGGGARREGRVVVVRGCAAESTASAHLHPTPHQHPSFASLPHPLGGCLSPQ